jgi:hypothetical protein
MSRDYCFRVTAFVRDDAMTGSIEMPVFTVPFDNLPASKLPEAYTAFLNAINEPDNQKTARDILKNLSRAINSEHAMDLEIKRLLP